MILAILLISIASLSVSGYSLYLLKTDLRAFIGRLPEVKGTQKCRCGRPVAVYHGEPEGQKDCHLCRLRNS